MISAQFHAMKNYMYTVKFYTRKLTLNIVNYHNVTHAADNVKVYATQMPV